MRKPLGKQFYKGSQKLPFREACQIDQVVYLSGQLALGADGKLVGDNIKDQTRAVFNNIEDVLSRCELSIDEVFKATVWLADRNDFLAFNEVFQEVFTDNLPVRSTVVSSLAIPGALVEVEVMAYAGD